MQRSIPIKICFYVASFLLVLLCIVAIAASSYGIKLNESKLSELENNPIFLELVEKLESGEIEAKNDLALMFVKNNVEIQVTTTHWVTNIHEVKIFLGLGGLCLLVAQIVLAVCVFRK
jgi:hypothetical protein